jgi:hypothetical protein
VLEFEEFLKIKGCKQSKHIFVGGGSAEAAKAAVATAQALPATYRHDWFQSPSTVTVSIYAKKVDASKASVLFESQRVYFVRRVLTLVDAH